LLAAAELLAAAPGDAGVLGGGEVGWDVDGLAVGEADWVAGAVVAWLAAEVVLSAEDG
jgi:hypothetical protein